MNPRETQPAMPEGTLSVPGALPAGPLPVPAVYVPPAARKAGGLSTARLASSSTFQVDSDLALGTAGQAVAQGILQTADRDITTIAQVFGISPVQRPFLIHITQTSPIDGRLLQGARHFGAGTEI
jgi:hypothetical protein